MKNLIYLLILGTASLFSACHDITVGYLFVAPTAGYSQDTMPIFNIENEIKRLNYLQETFKIETAEQQDQLAQLEVEYKEKFQEARDAYDEMLGPLEDEMDADPDNFDYDHYFDVYYEWSEKYEEPLFDITNEIEEIKNELDRIAEEMGLDAPEVIAKHIEEYHNKIDFNLPWTTPRIEGVQGTEPLIYTVISVKNENPENAAKFMNYVGTMGGGVIYVDLNVDVPVGTYTVTLEVKNEGRTKILNDVFTFLVKAEDSDTPIEE